MDDDEALVNEELHWRSRPGKRRRPPGGNAITAIGLAITLVLWGITGVAASRLLSGPSGSGVIDPKSAVMFLVFGLELFLAAVLSGRVWVAIGPTARGVLRPFGVLGPWPLFAVMGVAGLAVAAVVIAPFQARKPRPATSGTNWRLLEIPRNGVTYEEAVMRCEASGMERVPSRDDLARFDPPFSAQTRVWLEKPADATLPTVLDPDGTVVQMAGRAPGQPPHAQVVCFQP